MNKFLQFGEIVEGYDIPVLNEREIRAAAGILFLAVYTSLMFILFDGNFILVKYVLTFFLLDLLIRVLINPRFSPLMIAGRLIVRNQVPEYVGAPQKRFAWIIGIVLSATMFYFFIIVNAYSVITGSVCMVCLLFLFFEAAFGICLGCKIYPWFNRKKVQHCPGEVCDVRSRQEIQKVSVVQLTVLLLFIGLIFFASSQLNARYSKPPHDLFKTPATAKIR
ncbi:DUF4395 domain-containing protein [Chitinophaga ginsengisoli]|uniref:Uncharacterized protein DUF4395 n=1 Tax=Chitinophaga ginsengisoli TaxID=363837 RepID=A0A2P8FM86_9BACT|nr:DUF4395 domain-containing protein [Chitinophaga ginsengisoli]PSL22841.1 uncharacterized protein DUF4395 [Chitinophaga ginsengisoli]